MKKLLVLMIGFAFALNVQAQGNNPVLKTKDKKVGNASEITIPDEPAEVDKKTGKAEPEEVKEVEKPTKGKKDISDEKPAENDGKLKDRGDSQKPIHERGKGKPERVREKQEDKFHNKEIKKEHKKDKQKAKTPGKEKKGK